MQQNLLFESPVSSTGQPLKGQLLKWVGNKQKFAPSIISHFPENFGTYFEPFLGSGAILGTLAPEKAFGSDVFTPLIEIWEMLKKNPMKVIDWYEERYSLIGNIGKKEAYEKIKSSYNSSPNGADLLFLSRVCYGGVVRFRKADGYMSTPCGPHNPMPPENFKKRAINWSSRIQGTKFINSDFEEALEKSKSRDLVYLDPPYVDSQGILYGAQNFKIDRLFKCIERLKDKGVYVALSIDGTKKSGTQKVNIEFPEGLFEREVSIDLGSSMLKRFQLIDQNSDAHHVSDRLLLTY